MNTFKSIPCHPYLPTVHLIVFSVLVKNGKRECKYTSTMDGKGMEINANKIEY